MSQILDADTIMGNVNNTFFGQDFFGFLLADSLKYYVKCSTLLQHYRNFTFKVKSTSPKSHTFKVQSTYYQDPIHLFISRRRDLISSQIKVIVPKINSSKNRVPLPNVNFQNWLQYHYDIDTDAFQGRRGTNLLCVVVFFQVQIISWPQLQCVE